MSKNAQRSKLVLSQLTVLDAEDAMVVLDFVANIMPQIKRIYSRQEANLTLLRNRQRELTGRLEDLAVEQDVNTPSVVDIMKAQQGAEAIDDDEVQVDADEALNMLKEAAKESEEESKTKKSKKK